MVNINKYLKNYNNYYNNYNTCKNNLLNEHPNYNDIYICVLDNDINSILDTISIDIVNALLDNDCVEYIIKASYNLLLSYIEGEFRESLTEQLICDIIRNYYKIYKNDNNDVTYNIKLHNNKLCFNETHQENKIKNYIVNF